MVTWRDLLALNVVSSLAVAAGVAMAGEMPADVGHRREVARALDNAATFESALPAALKDDDPMIRRYALNALYEKDPKRALDASKAMMTDSSIAVRQVAKSMNRSGGLYRENVARSIDPQFDHDVTRVSTVRAKNGVFELAQAVPEGCWIELWFRTPKEDLYVWLNGTYLGQFDVDNQPGQRFRLDATAETNRTGKNEVVVKGASGNAVKVGFTVEVLK